MNPANQRKYPRLDTHHDTSFIATDLVLSSADVSRTFILSFLIVLVRRQKAPIISKLKEKQHMDARRVSRAFEPGMYYIRSVENFSVLYVP